jgi:hypothetical protein
MRARAAAVEDRAGGGGVQYGADNAAKDLGMLCKGECKRFRKIMLLRACATHFSQEFEDSFPGCRESDLYGWQGQSFALPCGRRMEDAIMWIVIEVHSGEVVVVEYA